jgi:zinc transporter ZupT
MAPLSIEMDGPVFAVLLCSLPAAAMFLGSVVAIMCMTREAKTTLSIAQNFSAGILIAAISTDLVPMLLKSGSGIIGTVGMSIGFFGGFTLLTAVKACLPEEEGDGEEANDEEKNARARTHSGQISRLQRAATSLSEVRAPDESPLPVQWTFALPVYIDCVMDGFLLGVIAAASPQAGAVMSVATGIEMGFLGVTVGALLKPCGWKRWPLVLLGPILLLSTGVLTGLGAGVIAEHRAILEGLLAFGASSLLFLVTQELLEEARSNSSNTSAWLFIGFFVIVLSDRLLIRARLV